MKLCYIAGGISTHTLKLANWMAAHGQEVSIISYTPFTLNFHPSIKKYELKKIGAMSAILNKPRRLWWYNPLLPFTMRKLMLQIQPDITETHYVGPTGMLLARLANHHPHIMYCQGSDILTWPDTPAHKAQLRKSLSQADAIVYMSEEMQHIGNNIIGGFTYDRSCQPIRTQQTAVINLGVDTELFRPHIPYKYGRTDMTLLNAYNKWTRYPVILSTRQNKPIYDLKTLIAAIPLIRQQQKADFVFAGTNTDKLDLPLDCISMGEIPPERMSSLYQTSDLYVSTALSDGTCVSTLEALATDLPCVLSDIPANRPWVAPEYLFKPGDPADLARIILYTLANPPPVGSNRERAIRKADHNTEMNKLLKLYEELKR